MRRLAVSAAGRRRDIARSAAGLVLVLVTVGPAAFASDTGLSGAEGHPRSRFPLRLYARSTAEGPLDAAVDRALLDWNSLAREALGVDAFARAQSDGDPQIVVAFVASADGRLMGMTSLSSTDGTIDLPVRIDVMAPQPRGGTSRETVLYQVLAHELGHALGLPHVNDPRSLMCCVAGRLDFNDPETREAYVTARRHPDVRSVRAQLAAHYERFWRPPPEGAALRGLR